VLSNGIPAEDLLFRGINCSKPGEIHKALETFVEYGKELNLLIHDISFVPKGDEIIAICLYTKHKS